MRTECGQVKGKKSFRQGNWNKNLTEKIKVNKPGQLWLAECVQLHVTLWIKISIKMQFRNV